MITFATPLPNMPKLSKFSFGWQSSVSMVFRELLKKAFFGVNQIAFAKKPLLFA